MKKALDYSVLSFSLLTVLFLSACNNDEDDMDPSKPSIEVTVVNSNNEAVENATVTLLNFDDPLSSKIKFTDEEGLAVFPDLDTARYVMTAEKSGVGIANASVTVEEAMVYSETLELNAVTLNTQGPTIFTVDDEYLPYSMMPIDTVEINLEFMDNDTAIPDLVVTATCDIDGELFAGNPNSEERVHIQHIPGTKGVHEITVTATDKNGNQTTKVFTANAVDVVPTEVSSTKQYKKVLLEWADNVEQDFQKLEVQRMNYATDEYEVLATFTDETVTSFVDDDIPYWGNSLHRIVTYDSENRKGESNIANTSYPAGVFFNYSGDTEIKNIQLHPDRDWVYIITNDNSNNKIFIYDYQQDIIVKELSLDYLPGYAVLADNGSGLQMFVPSADGGIYIYSSDEQMDLLQTIETGEPCTSVAMNGNGIIVAGMDLGYNEDYAARTYSQSTGNMIDSTGLYTEIRVFGVPNKPNVFMGIDYTTSIWELLYFEIDNNGFFTMDVKDDKGFDYDIDFRITSVSKTGDYIICEDDIFETNSGMAHITSFPTTSMKSATTNADGSMIYAFDFYESKQISSYSYPSLTQQTSYPTLESPVFVKVKGNKAIVLSGTYVGIKSIIEVIDL